MKIGYYVLYVEERQEKTSFLRDFPACAVLMCIENGFCQCAGFEQGETEDNGIGCKGENRAVQVVRYHHFAYQNCVNANAYHNEEALKPKCKQPL